MRPMWVFSFADRNGPFSWQDVDGDTTLRIVHKFAEFEQYTWTQLQQTGDHHSVDVDKICREAQDRLKALHLEDVIDSVFSFKISARECVWGYLDQHVYRVLWWD